MLLKVETASNGLVVHDASGGIHLINGRSELSDEERQKAVAQELGELVLVLVAQPQPKLVTEPAKQMGEKARERQTQDADQGGPELHGAALEDAFEDALSRHGARIAGDFLGFLRGVSRNGGKQG